MRTSLPHTHTHPENSGSGIWYSLLLPPAECGRSRLQQEHGASKNETVHISKTAIVFNPIDAIAQSLQATYQRLSEIPDPKLPVKYPRTPGYRPVGKDNRLNAWQVCYSTVFFMAS